jgi:multidrug efflux system membrane fusion protein
VSRSRVAVGLVALATAAVGCGDRAGAQKTPPPPPPVPVTVADVVQRTVPLQVTVAGNVQAYTTVAVKSQVAGEIAQVHFAEGHDVRRGDPLFTIDPRPLEAALRQAEAALGQRRAEVAQTEANLARDLAQLDMARVQERRYHDLLDKELIAREQYDQVRTNFAALEATARATRAAVENAKAAAAAAQAAVDNAKLQLGYTQIRAAMDGRTGNLLVQRGNVVKANEDHPLVVITQLRPIYVSFAVPEQYLDAINRFRAAGPLRVEVRVPDRAQPVAGELTFVNNVVDATTGTIQLKATFANAEGALWPGQFVQAWLTLTNQSAVLVPSQAVQAGQQGTYVFVVKPDLRVEARPVRVARRLEREAIIEHGLTPGERVVTDGQLRLVPGAKVEIKPPKPA